MGTTSKPRRPKPTTVSLTGGWPVIGGIEFSPDARIPGDSWRDVPSHQKRRVWRFLYDRGRKAQYTKTGETAAGYEAVMVNAALEVDGPPETTLVGGPLSILVDDIRVRHGDMVWCNIGGAASSKEARKMFREWLEDVIHFGCDLLDPPSTGNITPSPKG